MLGQVIMLIIISFQQICQKQKQNLFPFPPSPAETFINFMSLYYFLVQSKTREMNWLNSNKVSVKDPLATPTRSVKQKASLDSKNYSNRSFKYATPEKINSHPSLSLEKVPSRTIQQNNKSTSSVVTRKNQFKLPNLNRRSLVQENPESRPQKIEQIFYQSQVFYALSTFNTTYMMSLARQHFQQTIEALRITKHLKLAKPKKQIKLEKKSPYKKTIYLDLDETLIHTDENSNNYSVRLNFPVGKGVTIQAGVRIRPYCRQFLEELSKFAQIIIFTASSSSYADVILNHIDPENKYFAHRLYRNHCTLEKGFYVKDLRVVNRSLQNVAIVDNSAYSFFLQPENGIPILPYYHYNNDRELQSLLIFLKQVVEEQDCRDVISRTFFWQIYLKDHSEPKKLFLKRYKKVMEEIKTHNG